MTERLRVNPILCAGHSICAELFPERVELDEWGFPIVDQAPIPSSLLPHARRAVTECPTAALLLAAERAAPSRTRR